MNWKDIPIPDQGQLRARRGARQHPLRIDSAENMERGVNILLHGIAGANYYFLEDNPPYMHRVPGAIPELYVREGVLARLLRVNSTLSLFHLELFVHDAYRPVDVQNYFHDEWVPAHVRAEHPEWTSEQVEREVAMYWAKGFPNKHAIDPFSPPPHATGGVVDLTLRDINTHELIFMGSPFDEVSPRSFADHFERESEQRTLTTLEQTAQENRRILHHAMREEGFVVNPNEWWHFGYGDQLSAWNSGEPAAVYSVLWLPGESDPMIINSANGHHD